MADIEAVISQLQADLDGLTAEARRYFSDEANSN